MSNETETNERIMRAAGELFIAQGIRKTSLEEIAQRAGVSRMTIYRYHGDKKGLVRHMFESAAKVFERVRASMKKGAPEDILGVLGQFQSGLGRMSSASFIGRFDELSRVYPDIYEEYRAKRKAALDSVFGTVLKTLKQRGMLRPGINETVLRAVFFDAIVNIVENPEVAGTKLPREEIFRTIREVLLFGIIDTGAADAKKQRH